MLGFVFGRFATLIGFYRDINYHLPVIIKSRIYHDWCIILPTSHDSQVAAGFVAVPEIFTSPRSFGETPQECNLILDSHELDIF